MNARQPADGPLRNPALIFAALDRAVDEALRNARICGADARALAAELIDNVEWAKDIIALAVVEGYLNAPLQ